MPVEIKELVIRAVVRDDGRDKPASGHAGGGYNSGAFQGDGAAGDDVVVRRAVDEVLRILKASKER